MGVLHKYTLRIVWIVMAPIAGLAYFFFTRPETPHPPIALLPENPTFTQHIAPILLKNCLPCHRKNGAAPFSLESFSAVKKRAKTIARVTLLRYMPPWPADPLYSHFIGEKVLSQIQIDMIQRWYKTGANEGPKTQFSYRVPLLSRSNIRKPDLVIQFDSIALHEGDQDRFYIMKTHVQIPQDRVVSALEFVPGVFGLVHHVNGHLLLYQDGNKKNPKHASLTFDVSQANETYRFKALELEQDDGSLPERIHSAFNYLPGVEGIEYPNGIGTFTLTKKFAVVLNDIHYGPSDQNVVDHSVLNIFFTKNKPNRVTAELMLGTNGRSKISPPLVLYPNKISTHSTRYTIDADISVLTINPHLHQLGKSFLAFAIKPNGDTIPLIRINRWNFNWQYFYTFKKMTKIPAGSEIIAIAVFDNTATNKFNPNRPPIEVRERFDRGGASMRASDEMFQCILTYTPYLINDETMSLEKNTPHAGN